MFKGFTDKSFEFFMAIHFNNNRDFFHENHAWYVESVREPLRDLAAELADTIEEIDPELERRPEKTVSRLNRDLRFTKDKSPYRDYMWIGFDAVGENKSRKPGFYVSIDSNCVSLGMGIYEENRPLMNAFRQLLVKNTELMDEYMDALAGHFTLDINGFKRLEIPQELTGYGKLWYPVRTFNFNRNIDDYALMCSPELSASLRDELLKLKDIYRFFAGITPLM